MPQDWHPEDIKAAIRKRGTNLTRLARQIGLRPQAFAHVLRQPREAAERVIAEAIGVPASVIWPSRYESDGRRKTPQPVDNYQVIHRAGNQIDVYASRIDA